MERQNFFDGENIHILGVSRIQCVKMFHFYSTELTLKTVEKGVENVEKWEFWAGFQHNSGNFGKNGAAISRRLLKTLLITWKKQV